MRAPTVGRTPAEHSDGGARTRAALRYAVNEDNASTARVWATRVPPHVKGQRSEILALHRIVDRLELRDASRAVLRVICAESGWRWVLLALRSEPNPRLRLLAPIRVPGAL